MAGTPPGQLEGPAPIKPIAALLSVCWSETPIARPPIQQCLKIVSLPAVQTIQTPAPKALAISSQKNPTRSRKAPPNPDPLSVPPWDHFPDLQMQGRLVVDHVWTIPRSPDWWAAPYCSKTDRWLIDLFYPGRRIMYPAYISCRMACLLLCVIKPASIFTTYQRRVLSSK